MRVATTCVVATDVRRLAIVVAVAVLWVGCAQTQLTIHGSGFRDDEKPIRVTSRTKLSLVFGTDNLDSTKVRSGDGYAAAPVNIVEVDADHLLAKSDKWPSVSDVPASYLKNPGVFVTARHFKYGRPTVRIPLSAVQEIIVTEKQYHPPAVLIRLPVVPKWIGQGAAIGMAAVLGVLLPEDHYEFYRVDKYDLDSDDALAAATVGVIGGATLNTLGRLLWPEIEYGRQSYSVNRGNWWTHGNR